MPRIRTKSSSKSSSSALGPSGPPSPIKVVNLIHRPSSATTPSPCHPTSTVSKHGRASSGWLPLDGQKNDTASHTSEQCFLSTLPYELIITIVSLVDVRSRCRLARSSKHLKSTLYSEPSLWSRLDLSNRYSLGGDKRSTSRVSETMPVLFANSHSAARFRSLAKLDVSCTDMDLFLLTLPKIQPILAHSLTHLILNGCSNISSGSLYYLKHFPNLQALDLSHCEGIDDTALEVISFYLPNITHLNLSYLFRISERGISRLFRLPHLSSVNLMGCYRIKQYPWATASDGASRSILPIKELMLGEDSRIQTRGFWLLWCTFNFSTDRLVSLCPHLETLRLNMVLFDLPSDGLFTLLTHLHHLKHLSLVIDRVSVPALCTAASRLQQLDTFEATLHIGVSGDLVEQLVRANTFARLKALKFHSKHTTVFSDTSLAALVSSAPKLEYLELNGDDISPTGMTPVTQLKHLQSLLVHHTQCSNRTFKLLNQLKLRELTMTDWKQMEYSNRIWWIVKDRTGVWESLKKLELSGHALATEGSATPAGRHTRRGAGGVADKDLARLIERCQQLQ
ncbi:hypothetical protein BC832DRAFT_592966 [Gaertneriomyces semiglobifer]|nr:hypothetical protein BC832DRAFT_592966 [Gaertneriomyces semiglobifer]